jgi:hypothetical protein
MLTKNWKNPNAYHWEYVCVSKYNGILFSNKNEVTFKTTTALSEISKHFAMRKSGSKGK